MQRGSSSSVGRAPFLCQTIGAKPYPVSDHKPHVNEQKNTLARSWNGKLLDFRFTRGKVLKGRVEPKALARLNERVQELTRRKKGVSLEQLPRTFELSTRLCGCSWYCEIPTVRQDLDSWCHRRPRAVVWKQWRRGKTRFADLRKWNVRVELAAQAAGSHDGGYATTSFPRSEHFTVYRFLKLFGAHVACRHREGEGAPPMKLAQSNR